MNRTYIFKNWPGAGVLCLYNLLPFRMNLITGYRYRILSVATNYDISVNQIKNTAICCFRCEPTFLVILLMLPYVLLADTS